MLIANGLVKRYGKRTVVNGVSIQVAQGEIVGLLGPNGAGKTTTFYMMVGLVRPDDGDVLLDDVPLTDLPVHLRAKRGIGYLAQDPSVFRGLSVAQNILMVLQANGTSPQQRQGRLDELLREFGLTHVRDQLGLTLSGGERRRVEIARVLAMNPSYVLLDEPLTGVDPLAVSEIQDIVRYLRGRGIGIIITDHNVRDTLAITDRATVINEGRILLSGTPDEILVHPEVRRVFLGERFEL
ncbi:MAG: LPS export ABC transporter ATP-binding protein [Armatimonadetes bacterium]|nr:LPS export ABC transporter ATP-binding protein [Armatimonadota bacterium]